MKRLFNPEENNLIQERINKLTPDSRALWGKMNVSQMLLIIFTNTDVSSIRPVDIKGWINGFSFW